MKTIDEKSVVSKWFDRNANWYVLFVRTTAEVRVAERLNRELDNEKYWAFIPTRDYVFRQKGKTVIKHIPWLAGYVFVIGLSGSDECVGVINTFAERDPNIYRLLSADGSIKGSELAERDKNMMRSLLDENFNVPIVKAIRKGDYVRLLNEFLATVEKVNHQKQIAYVKINLFQREVRTEIAYELMLDSTDISFPEL